MNWPCMHNHAQVLIDGIHPNARCSRPLRVPMLTMVPFGIKSLPTPDVASVTKMRYCELRFAGRNSLSFSI